MIEDRLGLDGDVTTVALEFRLQEDLFWELFQSWSSTVKAQLMISILVFHFTPLWRQGDSGDSARFPSDKI